MAMAGPTQTQPMKTVKIEIEQKSKSLAQHPFKKYRVRPEHLIQKVIFHHSATRIGSAEAFANYHVNENDWPGIGYHFVILGGSIVQTQPLNRITYHCKGQNTTSIGVCIVGNFDERAPTIEEYGAAAHLVAYLDDLLPHLTHLDVEYHRDHSRKTCPGTRFVTAFFKALYTIVRFGVPKKISGW